MREESRDPALHLVRSLLLEYRAYRLSAAEESRVQRHLEACADCRALAVEVSAFFDPPEAEEDPSPAERSASWERVRGALGGEGWFRDQRRRRIRKVAQVLFAAAALLAATAVGLRQFAWYGVADKILVPAGAYKGPAEEPRLVELPARLRLTLAGVEASAAYRAELLDERGAKVRSFEALRRDRQGRVVLPLRRGLLRPGRYLLQLRAEGQGSAEPIDRYRIEIPTG